MESLIQRKPLTASPATATAVLLLVLAAVTGTVKSQTPSTQITCMNAFVTLLPCVGYVTGINDTAPSACCNGFVAVILNNAAPCLCQFLGTANPLGVPVNQTQTLALPAACNVNISSLATQCTAIGVPLNAAIPAPNASLTPTASPGDLPVTIPGSSLVPPSPTAAIVPAFNVSSSPAPLPEETPNLAPFKTPGDSISGPTVPTSSESVSNNSPAAAINNLAGIGTSADTAANGASRVLTLCTGGSLIILGISAIILL